MDNKEFYEGLLHSRTGAVEELVKLYDPQASYVVVVQGERLLSIKGQAKLLSHFEEVWGELDFLYPHWELLDVLEDRQSLLKARCEFSYESGAAHDRKTETVSDLVKLSQQGKIIEHEVSLENGGRLHGICPTTGDSNVGNTGKIRKG